MVLTDPTLKKHVDAGPVAKTEPVAVSEHEDDNRQDEAAPAARKEGKGLGLLRRFFSPDETVEAPAENTPEPEAPAEEPKKSKKKRGKEKPAKFEEPDNQTIDIMPYMKIVNEDTIQMTETVFTDYLQFEMYPVDDSDADDQDHAFYELYNQVLQYKGCVNWVFTNFPLDLQANRNYLETRKNLFKPENEIVAKSQKDADVLLDYIQHDRQSQEAYLQIFAETKEDLGEVRNKMMEQSGKFIRLTQISLKKKVQILYKLNNPLAHVPDEVYMATDESRGPEMAKVVEKHGYDPAFLGQIQPMGGVGVIDQNTINLGNGYLRTLHVYSYKKDNRMFWAARNFLDLGATVTMSIKYIDLAGRDNDLNRALTEQADRVNHGRRYTDKKRAKNDLESVQMLIDSLLANHESLFQVHTRVYLVGRSIEELNDKEADVESKLSHRGLGATPYADEAIPEFIASMTSFDMQAEDVYHKGSEMRGRSLAGSYPFLYAQLVDPNGLFVGQTLSARDAHGVVALNQYTNNRSRTSYSGWFLGKQGYGKSTAIKIMARNNHILGNYSYMFMVSAEARKMVESYGGLHVDGGKSTVNFLQILPLVVDEDTNVIDSKASYTSSLSNASVIFNLATEVEDGSDTSDTFQMELDEFYRIWMKEHGMEMDQITEYPPDKYPIAADFCDRLIRIRNHKAQEGTQAESLEGYDRLIRKLKILTTTYGELFNRTSQYNIFSYRMVAFNMQSLLKTKEAIYNAQYYNLFNLVYSESLRRGLEQKRLVEEHKITPDQVKYSDIISDEFHNVVRSGNVTLIGNMDKANREGRKVFMALHWATQGVDDVFPNYKSTSGTDELSKAVKSLFTLSPYRFIFRSDKSNQDLMAFAFDNEISQSDIAAIPRLGKGCCVGNIAGTTSVKFKWDLSRDDNALFTGGI